MVLGLVYQPSWIEGLCRSLEDRFIDKVLLDRTWVEGIDVDDNTVNAQAWTKLVVGYQGEARGGASRQLTFNVQNLIRPPSRRRAL